MMYRCCSIIVFMCVVVLVLSIVGIILEIKLIN